MSATDILTCSFYDFSHETSDNFLIPNVVEQPPEQSNSTPKQISVCSSNTSSANEPKTDEPKNTNKSKARLEQQTTGLQDQLILSEAERQEFLKKIFPETAEAVEVQSMNSRLGEILASDKTVIEHIEQILDEGSKNMEKPNNNDEEGPYHIDELFQTNSGKKSSPALANTPPSDDKPSKENALTDELNKLFSIDEKNYLLQVVDSVVDSMLDPTTFTRTELNVFKTIANSVNYVLKIVLSRIGTIDNVDFVALSKTSSFIIFAYYGDKVQALLIYKNDAANNKKTKATILLFLLVPIILNIIFKRVMNKKVAVEQQLPPPLPSQPSNLMQQQQLQSKRRINSYSEEYGENGLAEEMYESPIVYNQFRTMDRQQPHVFQAYFRAGTKRRSTLMSRDY